MASKIDEITAKFGIVESKMFRGGVCLRSRTFAELWGSGFYLDTEETKTKISSLKDWQDCKVKGNKLKGIVS